MSLAAAITLSIILAEGLPRHIESFASYWAAMKLLDWRGGAITLWIAARDARSFNQAVTVLGELTNLAWILLLVAVFRQSDSNRDGSISRQLALESKMATMTWGLILTGYVVGLLLTPYRYSETRHLALQLGRQPPPFMDLVTSGTRGVLIQACFFIAPYIVYRSRSKPEGLEATSPRR